MPYKLEIKAHVKSHIPEGISAKKGIWIKKRFCSNGTPVN
jgi:hypothetical protein